MNTQEILNVLITEGCPSIAYRTRKEIKQEEFSKQEYLDYQNKIYADPKVQKILSWQNADGYFGTRLHTPPTGSKIWSHEGCVRYLLETGLDNEDVRRSLDVMLQPGWSKEFENSKSAYVLGYEMIPASLFAQAGYKDTERITKWVYNALQGFQYIADAKSYADLIQERTDQKFIFREGMYIPVIYHLRLLAFTDFWRTKENMEMLKIAYEKLYQWLPFPPTYLKAKSRPVAPLGNVCLAVNGKFQGDLGFSWVHFYEMSARMGMLSKNSPFREYFDEFQEEIMNQSDNVIEYAKKKKSMYIGWSGYSGCALEGDWKTKQQVIRDFLFRVMIIDKYCDRI